MILGKTRKARAAELYAKLERGQASLRDPGAEEARNNYRIWATTWILNELRDLIPELKGLPDAHPTTNPPEQKGRPQ